MNLADVQTVFGVPDIGPIMHQLIADLYPLCRSITGSGVRATLDRLKAYIPLVCHEVPTGTQVFDWTVPKEWNIRDAYVKNSRGERVIDFRRSNLHVVNYSAPVRAKMPLAELRSHLHTLPEYPDWIPYRTSYYNDNWGFCLSHTQLQALPDDEYEVCIDASLAPGHLTYGEYYLAGQSRDEVLISCHVCHPSLCNDNLSGIALTTCFAKSLSTRALRYSYRFLFIPGTIGSITWLARNAVNVHRIKHGLVVTSVGDASPFTYKKSRRGDTEIDQAVQHVLQHTGRNYHVIDFFPYGYDERQYCSPGFNLPIGCFMRARHGQFPEYHTSADNLDFVRPEYLTESLSTLLSVVDVLEHNRRYLNQNPYCEPQLGKRGLYRALGGHSDTKTYELAMLWVLNGSDGESTLLDIAEKSGLDFRLIKETAETLRQHQLLAECTAANNFSLPADQEAKHGQFYWSGRSRDRR